jgi:hypothetical protein
LSLIFPLQIQSYYEIKGFCASLENLGYTAMLVLFVSITLEGPPIFNPQSSEVLLMLINLPSKPSGFSCTRLQGAIETLQTPCPGNHYSRYSDRPMGATIGILRTVGLIGHEINV